VKFAPATGLYLLAAVALVGDIISVLTGHGTVALLDTVVLAALTGGAAITTPVQPAPAPVPAPAPAPAAPLLQASGGFTSVVPVGSPQ
jgi:hypothetical protein